MAEITHASLSELELARFCVTFALDKKALEPVILDLGKISTIADYLGKWGQASFLIRSS